MGVALTRRVQAHQGDYLLHKHWFDVFTNANVETVVDALSPAAIVLYGVALDVCDRYAIEGLLTRRPNIRLYGVTDAMKPIHQDAAARLLSDWQRRGVRVIEDAAQALGSYVGGRHLGTLGDCGCLSFSSQKIVTTGQGGAVVTSDEHVHATMRLLRDFGRTEGGTDRYVRVGWNLKFTDLQAVIGIQQLRRLPALIDQKRQLFAWYREMHPAELRE